MLHDENEICEAPELIHLDNHDLFKDEKGNLLDIETRGTERKPNAVYFKVEDVSNAFNIKNLQNNISKNHTTHAHGKDYVFLFVIKSTMY